MNAGTDAEVETTTAGTSLLFVQAAQKVMSRYATFGFNDDAKLDAGTMWPTAFVTTELTAADEARIGGS